MSTLLELQRRVAAAVMEPLTRAGRMRRRSRDGRYLEAEANELIKLNDRLTSFERLEIYNRQYWFRVLSSFAEDFPGLRAVIGSNKFERLMRAYLADCPSVSFTLRNLGSELEQWLTKHPEWTGPHERLALDMVRMEWAHIEAFDGRNDPVLTPADIENASDDLGITIQPYIQLLQVAYAVDDLLIEVHNKEAAGNTSSNAAREHGSRIQIRRYSARPKAEQIYLAVHRLENSIYYKRLDLEAYRILRALRDHEPLWDAFDKAFAGSAIPEDERTGLIQNWFANWAELGWFCRYVRQHTIKEGKETAWR
jgi:hypothetical protein